MNAIVYARVSSSMRRKKSRNNYCLREIVNGFVYVTCPNCGWIGGGNTISKDYFEPRGELKKYPRQKCPVC